MASRYDPLTRWLAGLADSKVTVTFEQVEALVGALPPSAAGRTWWANSGRGQSAGWLNAGWVVAGFNKDAKTVSFAVGVRNTRGGSGRKVVLDGKATREAFVGQAGWPSISAAVAAHTVFLEPATVAQTNGRAVFPIVRDPMRRGQIGELPGGQTVLFDDNSTPTDVFLWAANRVKGPDVQFNHVWSKPSDPSSYTALWNVCCTPHAWPR